MILPGCRFVRPPVKDLTNRSAAQPGVMPVKFAAILAARSGFFEGVARNVLQQTRKRIVGSGSEQHQVYRFHQAPSGLAVIELQLLRPR